MRASVRMSHAIREQEGDKGSLTLYFSVKYFCAKIAIKETLLSLNISFLAMMVFIDFYNY